MLFKISVVHLHVLTTIFLSLPQNHLSGGGTCQVDDRTYQLEMSLFIGEDIETMTNESFSPQGAYKTCNFFSNLHCYVVFKG